MTTGVVANADLGLETIAQLRYRRPAGATVMNESGEVPLGAVSDRLLRADAAAPWGVVLDETRVLRRVPDRRGPVRAAAPCSSRHRT